MSQACLLLAASLTLAVNGRPAPIQRIGDFALVSRPPAPFEIAMMYALPVRKTTEATSGVRFEITWRGDEIAGITPNTDFFPFYPTAGDGEVKILAPREVRAIQNEPGRPEDGRYDWGPSVMKDGDLYRMWWVRLDGPHDQWIHASVPLDDGTAHDFTYPNWGDRIWYAESKDGVHWPFSGQGGGVMRRVLSPAESAQEKWHVGCPTVIKVNGVYYLYYEASSAFKLDQDPSGGVKFDREYHNQIFLARSSDAVHWTKHPSNKDPQPIIAAPARNQRVGKRYGFGQPSVYYRHGRFVLHYVNSCTHPGDCVVRIEADNPEFTRPTVFHQRLAATNVPAGCVARFAQMKVNPLGTQEILVRPIYGAPRLGILTSASGVFAQDVRASRPGDVFPQIACDDPRGADWDQRLYPSFLTDPHGTILLQNGALTIYYSAGDGWKERCFTWDLRMLRIAQDRLEEVNR